MAEDGSIYIHIGPNVAHYIKAIMDDIFGFDRYINEIVWKRQSAHSDSRQGAQHYGRLHDIIFWYTKSEKHSWNQQYQPYDDTYIETFYSNIDASGRHFQ